jgi:TolB-like protein
MSGERIRRNGEPATAAEWYVAIDARAPDDVTAARLQAWLDRAAEHEPELERCSAAVEIARGLADDPALRSAYDEVAALAAGTARRRVPARRLAWAAALAAALVVGVAAIWVARDAQAPVRSAGPAAVASVSSAGLAASIAAAAPASDPALRLPSGVVVDAGSVAVLPFGVPPDDGTAAAKLAATLARDVGAQLAAAPGIYVIGAPQAAAYFDTDLDASEIGAQLGVRGVVVADLALEGDNVRVTASLLDAATNDRLWHADYERPVAEIAPLANEIGAEIASALVDPDSRARAAVAAFRDARAENTTASVRPDAALQ